MASTLLTGHALIQVAQVLQRLNHPWVHALEI